MKRRRFLDCFLSGSIIGTIGSLMYPIIRYVIPPKKADIGINSVTAAKIGELAPNESKIFRFGTTPGILIHSLEGEYKAFSAVCTHLTCTIIYEGDSESLFCPCHNGRFDMSGQVISGPPPSPLDVYEVETRGEEIIVIKTS